MYQGVPKAAWLEFFEAAAVVLTQSHLTPQHH
jgi:hypothetical protein